VRGAGADRALIPVQRGRQKRPGVHLFFSDRLADVRRRVAGAPLGEDVAQLEKRRQKHRDRHWNRLSGQSRDAAGELDGQILRRQRQFRQPPAVEHPGELDDRAQQPALQRKGRRQIRPRLPDRGPARLGRVQ
jgi:hypothetical protein